MIKQKGKYTQFVEAQELPQGVVIMPEQVMLGHMLVRAYCDVYKYKRGIERPKSKANRQDRIDTPNNPKVELRKLLEWFASDSEDPFSFLWCCSCYNPNWVTLPKLMREAITKPFVDRAFIRRINK